jgi:hypothetical protein
MWNHRFFVVCPPATQLVPAQLALPPVSIKYFFSPVTNTLNAKLNGAFSNAFAVSSFLFVDPLAFAGLAKRPSSSLHSFLQKCFAAITTANFVLVCRSTWNRAKHSELARTLRQKLPAMLA